MKWEIEGMRIFNDVRGYNALRDCIRGRLIIARGLYNEPGLEEISERKHSMGANFYDEKQAKQWSEQVGLRDCKSGDDYAVVDGLKGFVYLAKSHGMESLFLKDIRTQRVSKKLKFVGHGDRSDFENYIISYYTLSEIHAFGL